MSRAFFFQRLLKFPVRHFLFVHPHFLRSPLEFFKFLQLLVVIRAGVL